MSETNSKQTRPELSKVYSTSPTKVRDVLGALGSRPAGNASPSRRNLQKAPSSSVTEPNSHLVLPGEPSASTLPPSPSKPKAPEQKTFVFKEPLLGKISEDTGSSDLRADVELLLFPKEVLSSRSTAPGPLFVSFQDLKKTEGYRNKKALLGAQKDGLSGLNKRLGFNGAMKHKYLHSMALQSSATYLQVVKKSTAWENKKIDKVKIIKRSAFGKVDDINDNFEIAQLPTVQPKSVIGVFGAAVKVFFSDEERRSHIKNYKFAWYPCVEPVYKEAECLEGSSATLINDNIFVIGGFCNSSQKTVFVYNPAQDTVKNVDCVGSVPKCILYHTAVPFHEQIYVFGGDVGIGVANSKMTSNELWKFDTRFSEWKKIKSQKTPDPRKYHAACEFGSFMLVSGGIAEDSETPYSDFHAFSYETEEWTLVHDAVEWSGLSHHTMVPVYNSKVKGLYGKPPGSNVKHKMDSGDMINEGLFIFGGLKPREQPSSELVMVDTSQKPWKRRVIQPIGQGPKELYDHCSHYIMEMRLLLIYGGRNHKLFEARGRMALGEIYVLNVNYLVWSHVNIASPPGLVIERYSFNSVLHDHKLIVFGGLTDQNFAGFNVGRLELVESEARLVKGLKHDQKYPDSVKELVKKRKQLELKADQEELELRAQRQKKHRPDNFQLSELAEEHSSSMMAQNDVSHISGVIEASELQKPVPELSLPLESPSKRSPTMFRGFSALPDAFLDVMNQKQPKRPLALGLQPPATTRERSSARPERSRQPSAIESRFGRLPKLNTAV